MAKGAFASPPAPFLAPLFPWSATTGSYAAKNWLDLRSGGLQRTSLAITATTGANSARVVEWRVGPNRLFAAIQSAVVNPHSQEPAQALKLRLRRIWFAAPDLAVEEPHRWRNLIATAGRVLGHLWGAVEPSGDAKDFSERSDPSANICKGWDAFRLAGAATADSARSSVFGRSFSARAEELGLSMNECEAMGPRAKLRRVAESSC